MKRKIRKGKSGFLLGVYPIGFEHVDIYVDYNINGGWMDLNPSAEQHGIITIGFCGYRPCEWRKVVAIFLHETAEYLSARLRIRYDPSENASNSSGNFIFVATHEQFAELCARQGEVVAAALPDLGRAWKRYLKRRKGR